MCLCVCVFLYVYDCVCICVYVCVYICVCLCLCEYEHSYPPFQVTKLTQLTYRHCSAIPAAIKLLWSVCLGVCMHACFPLFKWALFLPSFAVLPFFCSFFSESVWVFQA